MGNIKFDDNKLMDHVKELQEKYGFTTTEEYKAIVKEHPEMAHVIIGEAGLAVIDSMVGKSFEELTEEDMKDLQGAGEDVNPETTIPCGAGLSFSVMVVLSVKHC